MVKNQTAMQETLIQSWIRKVPPEKGMATHSSIHAWKIPQRSLVGYSPRSHKDLDMTKQLTHHFFLLYNTQSVHIRFYCKNWNTYK